MSYLPQPAAAAASCCLCCNSTQAGHCLHVCPAAASAIQQLRTVPSASLTSSVANSHDSAGKLQYKDMCVSPYIDGTMMLDALLLLLLLLLHAVGSSLMHRMHMTVPSTVMWSFEKPCIVGCTHLMLNVIFSRSFVALLSTTSLVSVCVWMKDANSCRWHTSIIRTSRALVNMAGVYMLIDVHACSCRCCSFVVCSNLPLLAR